MYGASIGRLGIADFECATNQAIAYTKKIYGGISNWFLFYFLQAKKEAIISLGVGGAQPNISQTILKKISILLPPLGEQARIVSVLKLLMGRIQAAQEKLDEIDKIEKKLLKSFISNEDNEILPSVKLGKYCLEGTTRIGSNWNDKRLVGVSKEDGIIDLRVGNKVNFENYKIVQPNDFVYNPMRVDIGSIAIYDGKDIAITSPDYIVFRVQKCLSPLLLLKFLKSELGLAEINNNTQGSVRSRLYFSNLCNINYPLSEELYQQQAQKMLLVFKEISIQRKIIARKLILLKQSVLVKAFAGDLTIQDSNDEPTDLLIMRIQEEKLAERDRPRQPERQAFDPIIKPPKMMAEHLRSIKDILISSEGPMSAYAVWQQSIHKDNIEAFYAELKQLVDVEGSIVDEKEGDQSYLTLSNADN